MSNFLQQENMKHISLTKTHHLSWIFSLNSCSMAATYRWCMFALGLNVAKQVACVTWTADHAASMKISSSPYGNEPCCCWFSGIFAEGTSYSGSSWNSPKDPSAFFCLLGWANSSGATYSVPFSRIFITSVTYIFQEKMKQPKYTPSCLFVCLESMMKAKWIGKRAEEGMIF